MNIEEIKIGNQIWMKRNLDLDAFRNGDPIPQATSNEEWVLASKNKQPAWCYYDNDLLNGEKYQKLYNWYAVNDPRGLAPNGFHIPSNDEWSILINYLGGNHFWDAGTKMKNLTGWIDNRYGTNES